MDRHFTFGIYAGSVSGTPSGLTHALEDSPPLILKALDELQSNAANFHVRAYVHFRKKGEWQLDDDIYSQTLDRYVSANRKLDLVLCFRNPSPELSGWFDFITQALDQYGPDISRLQITQEPNLSFGTGFIDGDYPHIVTALVHGVSHAKQEMRRRGLIAQVGFSVFPSVGQPGDFWSKLASEAGPSFYADLDYVGLNLFPDVFRPALPDLHSEVVSALQHFRSIDLSGAGISDRTPIVVTEHGWPTGAARTEQQQFLNLDTLVRTIHAKREALNITGYQWFALRDSDSTNADPFHQFGMLRSDYSRKPTFGLYRDLVQELTEGAKFGVDL